METVAPVAKVAVGATVAISNRDRVLYPEAGITKGQLADHYAEMAPLMLPWIGSRPFGEVPARPAVPPSL